MAPSPSASPPRDVMMPGDTREDAAALLLGARHSRRWLPGLPQACRPGTMRDAYAIQERVLAALGPIAAWKVGAGKPDEEPACAPIAGTTLFDSGTSLPAEMFHLVGVEAEIAYRFEGALPPREAPYTLEEIQAAIASVHPAIEISDSRFVAWASQDRLSHVADQLNHGALVIGPGQENWQQFDPGRQRTVLTVDGVPLADVVGGNPAGDAMKLLLWLANTGARPFGGLQAGTIVTTGSVTGVAFVTPPMHAQAQLPGLGDVDVAVGRS